MLVQGVKAARLSLRVSGLRQLSSLKRCVSTKEKPVYDDEPMLPPGYPNLPIIHHQKRNPWIYDDQQDRRNFEEPLHHNHEMHTVWGPDIHDYPAHKALFEFLCVAGLIGTTCYIYSFFTPELKATRRSFPFDGLRVELGNDPNSTVNQRRVARVPDADE